MGCKKTETNCSIQTPVVRGDYDITNDSLEQLVEFYPLLSDLHVHLLGSGDARFWREQLSQYPQTVIPNDIQVRLGLEPVYQKEKNDLVFGDLVINEDLSKIFELNAPIPGRFDEEFSPLFTIRQFIVYKHPEVLPRLIQWNAERYEESGVHYAELSLGVGWYKREYLTHIIRGIKSAEKDYSVLFRLLIAFNRSQISSEIHDPDYLRGLAHSGDKKLALTEKAQYYPEHLRQLKTVKETLINCQNVKKYIIGFDIIGNEENRPYTPFLLPDILDFARDMRNNNPNFGFRLHLGEGISSDNDIGYVSLRLGEHYIQTLSQKHGFRVRSGHGIGLLGLNDEAFRRWGGRYQRMRKAASGWVLDNLQLAPVEINLTSNHYLLKGCGSFSSEDHSLRSHVMKPLLQKGFRIVLGTDDPGIFPDVTMRGEFRKAVDSGLIKDKKTFITIVMESVRASFADQDTFNQLASIISARYPGVALPKNIRSIPGLRSFDEPATGGGRIQEKRIADFQKALDAHNRGDCFAINDYLNETNPP